MKKDVKKIVREGYAEIAKGEKHCACGPKTSCCGNSQDYAEKVSKNIGYSDQDLKNVPDGANLGLGCGNPIALASLEKGETVLDLGAGAGFDCFLAAQEVGKSGKVIGVDMTHEMLEKARANAKKGGYENVEFRLGEIEHLPVADSSVDIVISNCVINLSPDKPQVFKEAMRVLKPGGRLMVSDIVLEKELPDVIRESVSAYVGCISGALMKDEYINEIKAAGFADVEILQESYFEIDCMLNDPTAKAIIDKANMGKKEIDDLSHAVLSVRVKGMKKEKN